MSALTAASNDVGRQDGPILPIRLLQHSEPYVGEQPTDTISHSERRARRQETDGINQSTPLFLEHGPCTQAIWFILAQTTPNEAALPDELNRPNPTHTFFSIPLSS